MITHARHTFLHNFPSHVALQTSCMTLWQLLKPFCDKQLVLNQCTQCVFQAIVIETFWVALRLIELMKIKDWCLGEIITALAE